MKINNSIRLVTKIYLLALTFFSIFRIILFLTELDRVHFEDTSIITIFQSFLMGVRFDIVISGYIMFLPALLLLIAEINGLRTKVIKTFCFYWTLILFSTSFLISAADIPYFNQFYDRFSIGAFEWIENFSFVFSMILQEPKYFGILIPFALLEVLFFIILRKMFNKNRKNINTNIYTNILTSILFLAVLFLGIRGRVQTKSPIRIGTAYFSDNPFLNKLGLNPVYTLMRSYLDSRSSKNAQLNLIDINTATRNVQKYLNIKTPQYKSSPIARRIIPDSISQTNPNIVIVIMESMSAANMKRHGNTTNITPFLDSLANNSIYFENIYTAGKHTFNGIFGTLFSFPALYRRHSMKQMSKYNGLSSVLKNKGYSTTYFTTHDGQFDNVEGFLRANDFQHIITQSDYPASEVKTTLGVPDDYMFRYAIPVINKMAKSNKPFFTALMTTSNHGPYYIPDYYHPNTTNLNDQIIEYSDWSLKQFITMASKEKWFNNTIFVFVADHGIPFDASYSISLNYFHSPLIIYAPELLSTKRVYSQIGSQLDVFPTLLGLLKKPYINNTMGIDLLNKKRKYTIINDDDKIGILDTTYFCIMKNKGTDLELYKYRTKDKTNYFSQDKKRASEMAEFAKSYMQLYQSMILKKETSIKEVSE